MQLCTVEIWETRDAFTALKNLLLLSQVLVHFDPKHPIVLACDASAHDIGAVLSHRFLDASEKPIGLLKSRKSWLCITIH